MFISILYVNIANLKSVPIEIFAEILNVFMIVRNIRQNSDVFYIKSRKMNCGRDGGLIAERFGKGGWTGGRKSDILIESDHTLTPRQEGGAADGCDSRNYSSGHGGFDLRMVEP